MNAFELVTSSHWAIRPDALRTIAEIAAREDVSPEAVAAKLGKPMENTRKASIREGADGRNNVAVIPITGPIFRRANMFMEISGATSIQVLSTDLRAALDNPEVSSIVLEIDSPGGEVTGIGEFAAMVKDGAARKPIHAYVDGLGCSAAYWIASAAQSITAAPSALLGSIGVVATIPHDPKKSAKSLEFVSSRSPNKRPDLDTEKGKATVQRTIDAMADLFIATVASNRAVTEDVVVSDFGEGGVMLGSEAVRAGMADHVGTFESLVASLNLGVCPTRTQPSPKKKGMKMDGKAETNGADDKPTITLEQFNTMQAESNARLAELEAKLQVAADREAATQRAALLGSAESAVELLVKSGKLLPPSKMKAAALLAQAALDDSGIKSHVAGLHDGKAVLVAAGNAVVDRHAALSAFLGSLPAHGYMTEHLTTEAIVLSNDTTGHADDEAADKALKARIAARNGNGNGNGKVHAGSN